MSPNRICYSVKLTGHLSVVRYHSAKCLTWIDIKKNNWPRNLYLFPVGLDQFFNYHGVLLWPSFSSTIFDKVNSSSWKLNEALIYLLSKSGSSHIGFLKALRRDVPTQKPGGKHRYMNEMIKFSHLIKQLKSARMTWVIFSELKEGGLLFNSNTNFAIKSWSSYHGCWAGLTCVHCQNNKIK